MELKKSTRWQFQESVRNLNVLQALSRPWTMKFLVANASLV